MSQIGTIMPDSRRQHAMGYAITIVCLANSKKPPSGRCVAGREVSSAGLGEWIRPVSVRSSQEISEEERRYQNGGDPKLLDIVTIQFDRAHPYRQQQENHVIDPRYYWEKQRAASWVEIQSAVDAPAGPLWVNDPASFYGVNDRVADDHLDEITRSLYLIRPEDLRLAVQSEGGRFGPAKRRVRAKFSLADSSYWISVTDPVVETEYLPKNDGEYTIGDALICVSLGEVFHGFAYKLAAAILTP